MAAASTVCTCGCSDASGSAAHQIIAALGDDDLDLAISSGLMECIACPACTPGCRELLRVAGDARRTAMAARDRFRARQARLARRQEERLHRRQAAGTVSTVTATSLPPAAAAALARARAKAAGSTPE